MARERQTIYGNVCALVWDVRDRAKILYAAHPSLTDMDPAFLDDLQLVQDAWELCDASRRSGFAIINAGEFTPYALRVLRDFERECPGVLTRLDDWKRRHDGTGDAA